MKLKFTFYPMRMDVPKAIKAYNLKIFDCFKIYYTDSKGRFTIHKDSHKTYVCTHIGDGYYVGLEINKKGIVDTESDKQRSTCVMYDKMIHKLSLRNIEVVE